MKAVSMCVALSDSSGTIFSLYRSSGRQWVVDSLKIFRCYITTSTNVAVAIDCAGAGAFRDTASIGVRILLFGIFIFLCFAWQDACGFVQAPLGRFEGFLHLAREAPKVWPVAKLKQL